MACVTIRPYAMSFLVTFSVFLTYQVFLKVKNAVHDDALNTVGAERKRSIEKHRCSKYPVILWWSAFTGEEGVIRQCSKGRCIFSQNRLLVDEEDTKAIIFYGSRFSVTDLPLPRDPKVQWDLLHEESPKNNLIITHEDVITLFNHTATFKRSSHFPLTTLHLHSLEELISDEYYVPLNIKNSLLTELAPILYIQSTCDTLSERDIYVQELMKYISVDSYGSCLNNRKLPPSLMNPLEDYKKQEFLHFVAKYKFTLSLENAVCEDYMTEKLWRPLIVGSVPIFLGSSTVRDWLPQQNSAIIVTDFQSPKALAEYIHELNEHDNLYSSYLQHKHEKLISNAKLKSELSQRQWSEDDFIEKFECFICDSLYDVGSTHSAQSDHLSCPAPVSPLTLKRNVSSWWLNHWYDTKREAEVLKELISQRKRFTPVEFYEMVYGTSNDL